LDACGVKGTKWILVVEDDDDNREVVIEVLHEAGYEAHGVSGGAAALRLLRTEQPCLILADLVMNDMNGKELLLQARSLLSGLMPAFVFLTGAAPSQLEDISGVVLTKPVDFHRLLGVVAHHCDAS
jgi:two-component system nitrogen regulation response regulator NtrX